MDQDHREHLEDRGRHQLEVEAYERERGVMVDWRALNAEPPPRGPMHSEEGAPLEIPEPDLFDIIVWGRNVFLNLKRGGYTFNEAVRLANAILSEVELATRVIDD